MVVLRKNLVVIRKNLVVIRRVWFELLQFARRVGMALVFALIWFCRVVLDCVVNR